MGINPIAEAINNLVIQINASDANREHAILLLGEVFKSALLSDLTVQQQNTIADLLNEECKRIAAGNLRYASGFFGNWAKSSMQQK